MSTHHTNLTRKTHSKTTCRRDWIIRIFHQDWPLRLHLLGTFPLVWYSRHGSNILNFPDRLHTTSCQRCTKLKSLRKNILFRFKNKQKHLTSNDSEKWPIMKPWLVRLHDINIPPNKNLTKHPNSRKIWLCQMFLHLSFSPFCCPTSAQNARFLKPLKTEFFLTSSQRVASAKKKKSTKAKATQVFERTGI